MAKTEQSTLRLADSRACNGKGKGETAAQLSRIITTAHPQYRELQTWLMQITALPRFLQAERQILATLAVEAACSPLRFLGAAVITPAAGQCKPITGSPAQTSLQLPIWPGRARHASFAALITHPAPLKLNNMPHLKPGNS